MYLITAILQPHAVDAVKDTLQHMGVHGMTISDARGFGRQRGHTETYRGAEYHTDFVPKVRLEVVAGDHDADRVADAITSTAASGRIGDGKIWVTRLERLVRIRTGEEGTDAV